MQRNFLSVSLIDTTGDEDVHINDTLCSEGLALFRMDALITVKAPIIKSSLRLLDRLKQEKYITEGRIITDKGGSGTSLPATYLAVRTIGDVNSSPVDDVGSGVLRPRLTVSKKLAALRLNADNPIPLNSATGLVFSLPNEQRLVSPQKLDERIVR